MAEGEALDQKRGEDRAWIAWTSSPPDHQSSTCLKAGVITIQILRNQNASKASDRDPTDEFSRRFITHKHVASSGASIRDPRGEI